ncbi:hypothetical protein [Virgibacillus sp. LDC-1]|uniref:hypothetical protein n=1 Tax=Virgibacillus sp. LDC-1 TaxID=3039856 RepID=UPI0024DE016F|nr:hypothetical protein [Virgibacillus sp. LDC-1]
MEEVFLEEVIQDIDINQINFEEYDPNISLSREEKEEEDHLILEKVLKVIKEKEKKNKKPNMINFDLDRYNRMKTLMDSPHFDLSNDNFLIAKFAGAATPLLEKRLKEVNLQYGQPVRNPDTKVWNYTINYSTNFIGLLYRHFLDYVNLMMDNLGYIPTCAWCKTPINPTPQQLPWLKKGYNIYCLEANQDPNDSCKRKGTTNKQNEKRRKQRERKNQVKPKIESIADRKIKNHITGKNLLTAEEQGDLILQSINVNLNQKFN